VDGIARKTDVVLLCDEGQKGWGTVLFNDSRHANLQFIVTITSEHACPVILPPTIAPADVTCGGNGWLYGKNCSCVVNDIGQY